MLQQTRASVVVEYYDRFLRRFPTLERLAEADEAEVLTAWSGLGYYRRARALHESARAVLAEYGGKIPGTAAELNRLPGVGVYTAAAVASIAFGEAVAAIDGNVDRVLTRYLGYEASRGGSRSGFLRQEATRLLDPKRPGDFNQAMMELGATVCLPKGPQCASCPVHGGCKTRGEHAVAPAQKMLSRKTALALLQRKAWPKSEILLERRPADASQMPGMWELPQVREGQENAQSVLLTVRHSITNTNYYVTVYGLVSGERARLVRSAGERVWVPLVELQERPLTGLTRKILKRLRVMPGYSGAGPAVVIGELVRDSDREFESAIFND